MSSEKEIVMSRIFNFPRERVFEAMTDPKQVVKWWGPHGFKDTIHEMDLKAGGHWRHTMHGPDGTDYPNHSIFEEIVKNEKIVYKHAGGTKEKGGACFKATWTFEDLGGKTKLTGRLSFGSTGEREHVEREYGAIEGGKQTLARLESFLSGHVEEFVISRFVKAPRELVWKAFTEPERMKQWWGPKGFQGIVQKMDFRPGGMYHYCLQGPDGVKIWGKMVYKEIVPMERLVFINSFSDEKGGTTRHPFSKDPWPLEMLTVLTFEDRNDGTIFTVYWAPYNSTKEEQDTFDKSRDSMNQGWSGTLEKLAEYTSKEPVRR